MATTNTPDIENVPTPPQFQASYIMPLPYPGAPGSPFFDGANVTEFLERYENMCEDYRVSLAEKIRRLPLYGEMFTARHVKSVIGFSGSDWTKISKELKKEYKDQDLAQQVSSRAYLEAFKDKPRAENSEVLQFCRQFSKITKDLVGKGKLDTYTQVRWFLQGLHSPIQSELFNQYNQDLDGEKALDFDDTLKKAYTFIESRRQMVELATTDIKNDRMSDLVDKSAKKSYL